MPSKTPDFIRQMQAEGTTTERNTENQEIRTKIRKEASKLASKLPPPPDSQVYVRNLLTKALRGDLDTEVFKEFVRMTNTYLEVEQVTPRVRMLIKKAKQP